MEAGARELSPASTRFVVPWRPDGDHRDRLWEHCRAHWEPLGIPIHTADVPGTFSRSASINQAAQGSWDVAVILDADVVAPVEQVYQAIQKATDTGHMTLGFTRYAGLTPHMTDRLLGGYAGPYDRGVRYRSDNHESSIVVVTRELWDTVGGFDERFVGWGQEDVAFAQACRVLGGPIERIDGTVWHLWHPHAEARDRSLPTYHAAQALGNRYRATTTPDAMRALLAEERMPVYQPDPATLMRVWAFSNIYRDNAWNGTDTRSGPGSGPEATERIATWLPAMCEEFGIASVLDAGCGEGTWQPDLPGYVGVDIVRDAIAVAQRTHPDRSYVVADICYDPLPTTDAVLCRDALQHLSLADSQAAVSNFRRAGAKYLIASSHRDAVNMDVKTGGWYPCNLEAAPFWLGPPVRTIFDGRWEGQDRYPTKYMGVWTLS